ncbi:MAG: CoB--CoM heterodisulfide reductase iron-sulfur subunit A family protein, partial [Desulfatiglandales bacterium]
EKEVAKEEPKVGVFVCHCGANIGRVVSVPEVVEYASKLPHVVHAQEQLFSCSTDSAKQITDVIKEKGLNRVIVAACTPRTHEPTFRDSLREAGLNQYFFEFANIREHCSWVHSMEKEEATRKAKDLVRMSWARAVRLEPLGEYELRVNKTALVVGGGVAGMTTALSLAKQGHEVYLVEREKELGGIARRLHYTLEGLDVQGFLKDLIKEVYAHPLVHVITDARILRVTGYVGNFVTTVQWDGFVKEIKHGATILATGATEYRPKEYLYGQDPRVMTNLELEERLAKGDESLKDLNTVVMIQCVGSRNEERNYCSRICCSQSIKNALKLKELKPDVDIYILFRDIRTYGFREDYYRLASDKGIRFIRYEPQSPPLVEVTHEGSLRVTVEDEILGSQLEIDTDLLSLAVAVVAPEGVEETALKFNATVGLDNFYKEAHVKLRPVDFGTDGVFVCGSAHYPKHIQEVIN